MTRPNLIRLCLVLMLAVILILTGCNPGWVRQSNSSNQVPNSSQPVIQAIQETQTIDPTLSAGLDQLDSQLNAVQSTLTNSDTLNDFK